MCTTATIDVGGAVSPDYGMHNNRDWGYAVAPGTEFSVSVSFDPMAHGPDAVGPIQRSVYLVTSSTDNGEYAKIDPKAGNNAVTELKVSGNVLYSDEYEKKKSDVGFVFDEVEYDFGLIKQSGGIISYDFEFEYTGDEPIAVTGVPASCACTSAKISQNDFVKGDKGVLTVDFDPNLHEEPEGKFFKTVSLLTEPALEEQPEVKVWVEIDLDLGPEAYKLQEPHDDLDNHDDGLAYHNVSPEELQEMLEAKDFFLLDVHIPEQEHIEETDAFVPYDQIDDYLDDLPEDKSEKIVVYCRSGSMSVEASNKLLDLGYTNVFNLEGGRNAFIELDN